MCDLVSRAARAARQLDAISSQTHWGLYHGTIRVISERSAQMRYGKYHVPQLHGFGASGYGFEYPRLSGTTMDQYDVQDSADTTIFAAEQSFFGESRYVSVLRCLEEADGVPGLGRSARLCLLQGLPWT